MKYIRFWVKIPPKIKPQKVPSGKVFVPESQWPPGGYKSQISYPLEIKFQVTDNTEADVGIDVNKIRVSLDDVKLI